LATASLTAAVFFTESAIITDEVIDNIRRVSPLAPLHNYANLSGIESAQQFISWRNSGGGI